MLHGVTITKSGPPLQETDLQAFEAEYDIVLPTEYKQFLLLHNGGNPKPNLFDYNHISFGPYAGGVRRFDPIDKKDPYSLSAYLRYRGSVIPSMSENLLPIGNDDGGNAICISTSGKNLGKIYFWEHDMGEGNHIHLVANSLSEFMASLYYRPLKISEKENFWHFIRRLLGLR
jgi:cell wall assembly regulator SMI1